MGCCGSSGTGTISSITISLFGLDNAGKTCISRALVGKFNDFDTVPTVGFSTTHLSYNDSIIEIYDLGGSARFRSVWQRYFAFISGFIWVVDSADKDKLEESKQTLNQIINHSMMTGKPYVIVANKSDLQGHASIDEIRRALDIPNDIQIIEASATESTDKCNPGLTKSLNSLLSQISENYKFLSEKIINDIEKQKEIQRKESEEKMARLRQMKENELDDIPNSTTTSSDQATETNDTNMNKSTTIETNCQDPAKEN